MWHVARYLESASKHGALSYYVRKGKKRRFYVLINIISDMCVQCDWLDGGTARSIHMQRVNNNTENLYHVVCTFIEMNG